MDARTRQIIRASGAGKKGRVVAQAILRAADRVFAETDAASDPWTAAELATAIFRTKAAEVFAAKYVATATNRGKVTDGGAT